MGNNQIKAIQHRGIVYSRIVVVIHYIYERCVGYVMICLFLFRLVLQINEKMRRFSLGSYNDITWLKDEGGKVFHMEINETKPNIKCDGN